MANNEAHNLLVRDALHALATAGYCCWPNNTGGMKTAEGGFIKFGKVGSADIIGILKPNGRHFEAEAKTGTGKQSKNQKIHQEFVVEKNGGIYILFRSVTELMEKLKGYII